MKRLLAVCLVLVLALSCMAFAEESTSEAESYKNALGYFTKYDFAKAQPIFSALGKYEDSQAYCEYIDVILMGDKGDYTPAALTINNLYSGLKYADKFVTYFTAMAHMKNQEFQQAADLFNSLGKFYKVSSQLKKLDTQYTKAAYAEAKAYMAAGEWDKAMEIYVKEGDRDMIKECYYQHANALRDEYDFNGAAELYGSIMGYKDALALYNRMITLQKTADKFAIGATIQFGRYPVAANITGTTVVAAEDEFGDYDGDVESVQHDWEYSWAPIEWTVLEMKEGRALLIANKAIDSQVFMKRTQDGESSEVGYLSSENNIAATWQNSYLRKWLNSEFIDKAFRTNEQALIAETTIPAEVNPEYKLYAGKDTNDRVFVLSISELRQYFKYNEDRKAEGTNYAIAFRAAAVNEQGYVYYWTRNNGSANDRAAVVLRDGSISNGGRPIDDITIAVRPAMWVNLY